MGCIIQKREYLCTRFTEMTDTLSAMIFVCFTNEKFCTGCSAVRLAHLLWEQGVVGSNPATPTNENQLFTSNCR